MKTKLIFLVLLIVCISCGTNNKPVSDAQKEKIKGEVKQAVNIIYRGAETAKIDTALELCLDSPDFVYISNKGDVINYKDFIEGMKSGFSSQKNQEGTIKSEKYAILDASTVLYTAESKWLINFKDGHSVLQDPWAVQFTFKKIDGRWRLTYFVESGTEKIVKPSETPKELNQIELHKQFVGSWKCDYAEDTTLFYDVKSYGTGIEQFLKFVTKGKTYQEVK